MISFKVSAPGKIILFGEHAVVYGKTAVAASLNRRTSIVFKQLSPENHSITIKLPKLGISRDVSVDKVSQVLFGAEFPRLSTDGHDKFYQRIREFVETMGLDEPRQRTSYECLFYALIQVAQQVGLNLQAFEMEIDTELSIGAGLGSSASFSVCLVATFLHWSRLQKSAAALPQFDRSSLETISQYALNCEKIMHGSPSGIDNSICTFGSVVEFRKGEVPRFIPLEARSLRVMLVDTKVGRSTKLLVEKVAGLMTKYPKIFPGIMDAIDEISKRAIDIIKEMQTLNDNDNEQLIQAHQELSVSYKSIIRSILK